MTNNWDNILKTRECLSQKELEAYQSGILSHDKKLDIERHLVDCDFCSDALEGYQKVAPYQKRILKWLYLSVTAAVLIFFLINPFGQEEKKDLLASNDQTPKKEIKENTKQEAKTKKDKEENKTVDYFNEADEESPETFEIQDTKTQSNEQISNNLNRTNSKTKKPLNKIETEPVVEEEVLEEETEQLEILEVEDKIDNEVSANLKSVETNKPFEISTDSSDSRLDNKRKAAADLSEAVVYKKGIVNKKLSNGKKTKQRKELKEEEIDYEALQDDYGMIQETDFQFDSLSPTERDSIGLILDEKRFEYEFSVGKELYEQKDYVQALEHLEKVIGSYGGNAYAIYLTARSYQEIEKYEKANKLFKALYETADVNTREKSLYNSAYCN
ncbi:tetratricopeptide repeat protein, partial [Flavobacteriales bacterium]|nr:tetratricopeptide repeat protein [Flavobacteriales bacterium]